MKPSLLWIVLVGVTVAVLAFGQGQKDYREPARLAELVAGNQVPPGAAGAFPYILVDVRTPAEYASGHIPTAINIPNTEIAERPPTEDSSALIIVYCRSGARSASARKALQALGYSNVVDFGSVSNWRGGLIEGDLPTGG
jgi:rhodanese-related sulfurtransferase